MTGLHVLCKPAKQNNNYSLLAHVAFEKQLGDCIMGERGSERARCLYVSMYMPVVCCSFFVFLHFSCYRMHGSNSGEKAKATATQTVKRKRGVNSSTKL